MLKSVRRFVTITTILLGFGCGGTDALTQQVRTVHYGDQKVQSIVYNMGINAIICGVGAIINKDENKRGHKVFLKGFTQGALGGYVNYLAKSNAHGVLKGASLEYAWTSKLISSIGASIVENAAGGHSLWHSYHLNLGMIRFEVSENNGYRPRAKLLPGATIGFLIACTKGRFDLENTLKTGTPFFFTDRSFVKNGYSYGGSNYINSIVVMEQDTALYRHVGHEFIHSLQYDDFVGTNWMVHEKYKPLSKWLYWDIQVIPWGLSYWALYRPPGNCYYNSFYEREAEILISRNSVLTCK